MDTLFWEPSTTYTFLSGDTATSSGIFSPLVISPKGVKTTSEKEVSGIEKRISEVIEIVKNICLNIDKGEFVGIMGQNGAGKTTLIRLFNGLLRPTKGNVYIDAENIRNKSIADLSKKIGIIFQNPMHQLFSNTLREEIEYSLKNLGLSKEKVQKKTDKIVSDYGFENYKDRSPLNLSGGESKKLAIASIACRNPDILVFDEPTLGQDAKEIEFFTNMVQNELNNGKTIIMVTHNIEFTMEYIPRTILMSKGQVIGDGPTKEIFSNESLIRKSSLITPQIYQIKKELSKIGIDLPKNIIKETEFTSYIINLLKNKNKNQ